MASLYILPVSLGETWKTEKSLEVPNPRGSTLRSVSSLFLAQSSETNSLGSLLPTARLEFLLPVLFNTSALFSYL